VFSCGAEREAVVEVKSRRVGRQLPGAVEVRGPAHALAMRWIRERAEARREVDDRRLAGELQEAPRRAADEEARKCIACGSQQAFSHYRF